VTAQTATSPTGVWSARNTAAPALVAETTQVLRWIGDGGSLDNVGNAIRSGVVLRLRTQSSRVAFAAAIRRRYLERTPVWALTDLVRASRRSGDDLRYLLYIHFCREDAFARALVQDFLSKHWRMGREYLHTADVQSFLEAAIDQQPHIRSWTISGRLKLVTNTLRAFTEFGLLTGIRRRRLRKPAPSSLVIEHLLRLIVPGRTAGASVLEDPLWQLFFLEPSEVVEHLGRLAAAARIRFEKTGSTVILEIPEDLEPLP
jgi:hypothetical protein